MFRLIRNISLLRLWQITLSRYVGVVSSNSSSVHDRLVVAILLASLVSLRGLHGIVLRPPGEIAVVPFEGREIVDVDVVAATSTTTSQRGTSPQTVSLGASLPDCFLPDLTPAPTQSSDRAWTCRDLRPVGACLLKYLPAWQEITCETWVLEVLRNGYAPTFATTRPPLTRSWRLYESVSDRTPQDQVPLLQSHVRELLEKQAVEQVHNLSSLGFYSLMFLVPKKNGKLRPIIDLRRLNDFLLIPSFQMETSGSVAAAVQPGDWATSLDLTDAYFHVPIAPWFRKYLRIVVLGKVYQYRALPFGLSTSPLAFTKMLEPLAVFLHSHGVVLHRYLDDLLIRSQSRSQCLAWTHSLLDLLVRLGLGVSLEKSDLVPSQTFTYIGIRFLTDRGLMSPPDDRVSNIRVACQAVIKQPTTARQWLSLIGLLGSAEKQVPFGRIHIRPIHLCLRRQFLIGVHPLSRLVSIDKDAEQAMHWWMDDANLLRGQPLGLYQPDVTLFTDACLASWGAHTETFHASGLWTPHESTLSINALELMAVLRVLQLHGSRWTGRKLLVVTDNSTAVAYINNQGGTRSMMCLDVTFDIFHWVQTLGLSIRARHIPGRLNRLADLLSRQQAIVNTEWTLLPSLIARLWSLWGRPHLDLMATSWNNQLPLYVSPFPDPRAFGVDAMSLSWDGMDAYVFPPWAQIQPLLIKLQSHQCCLTAVLPRWPNRAWFPLLLQSLIDSPRRLPISHDMILMPHNGRFHGQVHSLDLHVCRLSSTVNLTRDFLDRCRRESPWGAEEIQHTDFMTLNGRNSLFGVLDGVPILSQPL